MRGCTAAYSPLASGTLPTRSLIPASLACCAILLGTLSLSTGCATLAGRYCRNTSCGAAVDAEPCAELAPTETADGCEAAPGCGSGVATCATCLSIACPDICGHAQELCYHCCDFVWAPVWGLAEPVVCWPVNKVRHVVNFCAPDGFVGPPDMVGPGRFHPVPTHPVFAPVTTTSTAPVVATR